MKRQWFSTKNAMSLAETPKKVGPPWGVPPVIIQLLDWDGNHEMMGFSMNETLQLLGVPVSGNLHPVIHHVI
jgi:hypothetical protein